ncbi:pirin, partial [Staphylococcus sp. SIMBA_130]
PDMQGFQIWFEPHLREALRRKPTYQQFEHEEFQTIVKDGVKIKEILGDDSPVSFETDALMWDVLIEDEIMFHQSLT